VAKAKFWDCRGDERLTHTGMDDAIEDYLSDGGDIPETLEVRGFAPMELPAADVIAQSVLEHVFEFMFEDLLDPEADVKDSITTEIREAATAFAEVVHREYTPWACEVVCTGTVNVKDWVKRHRPDWSEDEEN